MNNKLIEALERIADPRNTHFAGDAQVVAQQALTEWKKGAVEQPKAPVEGPTPAEHAEALFKTGLQLLDQVTDQRLNSTQRYTAEKELTRVLSSLRCIARDARPQTPTCAAKDGKMNIINEVLQTLEVLKSLLQTFAQQQANTVPILIDAGHEYRRGDRVDVWMNSGTPRAHWDTGYYVVSGGKGGCENYLNVTKDPELRHNIVSYGVFRHTPLSDEEKKARAAIGSQV